MAEDKIRNETDRLNDVLGGIRLVAQTWGTSSAQGQEELGRLIDIYAKGADERRVSDFAPFRQNMAEALRKTFTRGSR